MCGHISAKPTREKLQDHCNNHLGEKKSWPKQTLIQQYALCKLCLLYKPASERSMICCSKMVAVLPVPWRNESSRAALFHESRCPPLYCTVQVHISMSFFLFLLSSFSPIFLHAFIKHCTLYKQLYKESSAVSSLGYVTTSKKNRDESVC